MNGYCVCVGKDLDLDLDLDLAGLENGGYHAMLNGWSIDTLVTHVELNYY